METLLAFTLVLLALGLAAQALAYLDVRLLAREAAGEAAHTAAQQGVAAGISRARTILATTPGLSAHLHATATLNGNTVSVQVSGSVPSLGPFAALLPQVREQARLPLEGYSPLEARR